MLILNADEAEKTVLMKRSMRPGCASIDKDVLYVPRTRWSTSTPAGALPHLPGGRRQGVLRAGGGQCRGLLLEDTAAPGGGHLSWRGLRGGEWSGCGVPVSATTVPDSFPWAAKVGQDGLLPTPRGRRWLTSPPGDS